MLDALGRNGLQGCEREGERVRRRGRERRGGGGEEESCTARKI